MSNKFLSILGIGAGLFFLYKSFNNESSFKISLDDILNIFSDSSSLFDDLSESVSLDSSTKAAVDSICNIASKTSYDSDKEYYINKLTDLIKNDPGIKTYAISKAGKVIDAMVFESSKRHAMDIILKA